MLWSSVANNQYFQVLEKHQVNSLNMKTTFFVTTIILSIVAFVKADNCTPGLNYCGSSLTAKGNYRAQLDQLYQDVIGTTVMSQDLWLGNLFHCDGGRSGVVSFVSLCHPTGLCNDNGNGKNDTCAS